jgi:hypothetical protein
MNVGGAGADDPAALAAAVITAISEREPERLRALLDERSRVLTGRSTHTGPDAIAAWAAKEYDHLQRRYAIESYRASGRRVLAVGAVQYVWSETGCVADSTPVALEMTFGDGHLETLSVHDDAAAALAAFGS